MTDIKHTPRHIARHTPAPWEHNATGLVYGQPEDETGGSTFVCDVVQDGLREWMDDTEKANARLIAAAPDLLEALEWYIAEEDAVLIDSNLTIDLRTFSELARAAIAKVRAA